jgi:hypothetical protein
MELLSWNLVDQKWLPCLMTSGQTQKLSLLELFTNLEKVQDLEMRDFEKLAVLRFLIALNTRILSPITQERWVEICSNPQILKDQAAAYFNDPQITALYDLFHSERPFMQTNMDKDKKGKPKEWWTLNTLSHYYASGLSPIVASHTLDHQFPKMHVSDIPVMLITGVLGHLTIWVGDMFNSSMMLKGGNVFTFLKGGHLLETLMFNTLYYDPSSDTAPIKTDFEKDNLSWELSDNPLWEETQSVHYPYKGFLHYLTYQSLAAKFKWVMGDDGELYATHCMLFPIGLPIQSLSESGVVLDPYVNWKMSKKGTAYPAASLEDKHFWKHLGAWVPSGVGSDNYCKISQPVVQLWDYQEILSAMDVQKVSILCIGVGTDQNNKKVKDVYSSELPLKLSLIADSVNITQLIGFIELSVKFGAQLSGALKAIFPDTNKKGSKIKNQKPKPAYIIDEYWATVKRKVHSYASRDAYNPKSGEIFLIRTALKGLNDMGSFLSVKQKAEFFNQKKIAKSVFSYELKKLQESRDIVK